MLILQALKQFYWNPFKRETLEEVIVGNMEDATIEVAQCDHAIYLTQFTRHMALAKIAAMAEWSNAQKPRRKK